MVLNKSIYIYTFVRPFCCPTTELKRCRVDGFNLIWLANFKYLTTTIFARSTCCPATELKWCRGAGGRHPQLLQGGANAKNFSIFHLRLSLCYQNLKIAHFPKIVVWFFHLLISQCYKCYDLIPTSAKLVILDTELILKQVTPHHVFVMRLSKIMLDFMYHLDNMHKMLASIHPRM